MKRLIIAILIISFIHYSGCSAFKEIKNEEITGVIEFTELKVTTRDSTKYHFAESDYIIQNGTLFGKGKKYL